jgi:uncharacterized circularly permuted ATP-grasp superfamily protein/uncharacterized alpha-E superfamily protein
MHVERMSSAPSSPAIDDSQPGAPTGFEYAGLPSFRDELLAADGAQRPHWQPFLRALQALGVTQLTRRWEDAKQMLRENGVTYNVYGDPRSIDRPWQLDPVPLLISPAEANILEGGLVQRARLLDAILADIYGPQRLLREGLIPAELVFGHPGFLRPCHGVKVPGNRYLHLYATDVGRGPDGAFRVISDRTQAPSGAGYALENRIVLSRMLPEIFRDCRVQRLALFFRTLRDGLRNLAPHNRDNPRIVLLTPGPYNETYFEHAYLARYLGYTLVEGGDLTVRDSRVYLKLLGGLQPVDVILRRLDDDYCDPLELRGDSFLGVPGLVHALRAGHVAVANALGSGLVETPALMPYLPIICRTFFGEELRLPSISAWWCGDPTSCRFVLDNLARLVIKPSSAARRFGPIFGERLNNEQREALAAKIRARPREFVAQEQLPLSTVPVFTEERLESRHVVIRGYLAATDDGYAVMPGGLTRVTATADTMVVSMQQGGGSKDTWVLSSGPVSSFTLLSSTVQPVELSRGGSDLPSRAADNLFWLGRYVERSEGLVRLLRGILARLTEKSGIAEAPEVPLLIRALALHVAPPKPTTEEGSRQPYAERFVRDVIFDDEKSDSLINTLRILNRVAGMVRDRISTDMWRVLSGLKVPGPIQREIEHRVRRNGDHDDNQRGPVAAETLGEAFDDINHLIGGLAAFGGLAMESMTRGQGWRFLDMGRRLERSFHIVRMLDGTLVTVSPNEGPLLEALLEIADSSMTYRRRYMSSLQTGPVLDLLLADESNPRSLAFQLIALADDVNHLPRDPAQPGRSAEQRLALGAVSSLQLAEIGELAAAKDGVRQHLGELLARLQRDLPLLSDAIVQHYLSHLQPSRHLAAPEQ